MKGVWNKARHAAALGHGGVKMNLVIEVFISEAEIIKWIWHLLSFKKSEEGNLFWVVEWTWKDLRWKTWNRVGRLDISGNSVRGCDNCRYTGCQETWFGNWVEELGGEDRRRNLAHGKKRKAVTALEGKLKK